MTWRKLWIVISIIGFLCLVILAISTIKHFGVGKDVSVGLLSGILATGFSTLVLDLYRTSFTPWLRTIMYNGISIRGKWISSDTNLAQNIQLILEQNADKVFGTLILTPKDKENINLEPIRIFTVTGAIRDRFITIQCTHHDPTRLGAVSLMVEVIKDGRHMKGAMAFYNVLHGFVDSAKVELQNESCGTSPGACPKPVPPGQLVNPKEKG